MTKNSIEVRELAAEFAIELYNRRQLGEVHIEFAPRLNT